MIRSRVLVASMTVLSSALVFASVAVFAGGSGVASASGDVSYSPSASDPMTLSWSPPALVDPITVEVDREWIGLDTARDYRVVFPDSPVRHRVSIEGGRNVVIIGGEIDIPWQGDGAPIYKRRGLLLKGQTGTVHVEGLLIGGEDLSEGIQIAAPEATVQLQNIRIEHVHARDQVNFSDNHPDVVQVWGGVGELRIDRLTGQSDYQGIFLKEDLGPMGPTTLRRVHIQGDPTARYLYWNENNLDVTLDRAYVTPAPDRSLEATLWPDIQSWPGLGVGLPPDGEYVPRDLVGIGYQAWPYGSTGNETETKTELPSNAAPIATFAASCNALTCTMDGTGSSDPDNDALTYEWDFGDGTKAHGPKPLHAYAGAGTRTVTLTVSDGTDSDDDSQPVSVDLHLVSLEVQPYKVKGAFHADLAWAGMSTSKVLVFVDGASPITTANDGAFTWSSKRKGSSSHTFRVCEVGTDVCSADVLAS